jgi:hypothetical protein
VHNRSAAVGITDQDGKSWFTVSAHQLASVSDPHCSLQKLIDRSQKPVPAKRLRHPGRPYHVWRHDLELARTLNDRLARGTAE